MNFDEQVHGAFNMIALGPQRHVEGYRLLAKLLEDYCQRPMPLGYDAESHVIFQQLGKLRPRRKAKDMRIASIVLRHDATLVTGNVGDFRHIPRLRIHRAWK